jgi:hypothetical protein
MTALTASQLQYLWFSDALKRLPGQAFENHHHPAVVLDRVSGPSTRVWGWWTQGDPALPCLLWCGEQGWSATVVEPDALDTKGYERVFWSHRIKLLDLALANALGPCRSLEELEMYAAADASFGLGTPGSTVKASMLWGILQLRSARTANLSQVRGDRLGQQADQWPAGVIDEELTRHALVPTLAKASVRHRKRKDPAVDALIRALVNIRPVRGRVDQDQ